MKLNEVEIKAIKIWTSAEMHEYRYIKGILRGDYNGELYDFYKKYADALIGLFEKYEDNTQGQTLYRGDILEDLDRQLSEEEIYRKFLDDNPIGKCIVLEDAILSFTLSKDIAIQSYRNSDKNINDKNPTILYVLQNRKSIFLDIGEYSQLPHEKEVLCGQNIKFRVMNIEVKNNNHLVYHLEECLSLEKEITP